MSRLAELDDWPRLKPIVVEALDRAPDDRGRYLDCACAGDAAMRARIDRYIEIYDHGGDALQPPSSVFARDPLNGQRIGRYTVLRLLGYGGMAAVYRARQDHSGRIVALKLMRAVIASPSSQRRFEYEAQVLARMDHPAIAQVYEAGSFHPEQPNPLGPVPYFAMEFVQGGKPITHFADSKSLTLQQRLELFAEVCDGAHHGHEHGVIHCDLKPANILVGDAGRPKIIDFGVARLVAADAPHMTLATTAGLIIGTPPYMAPEQCGDVGRAPTSESDDAVTPRSTAHGPNVDIRADVYALGATLYELLAGCPPHNVGDASLAQAVHLMREHQPASLSAVHHSLRGDVAAIVRKAMQKDRELRYPSAREFGEDIRRFLNHQPISAPRHSTPAEPIGPAHATPTAVAKRFIAALKHHR